MSDPDISEFVLRKAEYPQRTCREPVWGDIQSYSCELPDVHPGPHVSLSVQQSVRVRHQWELNNPEWEQDIGSTDFIV